MKYLLLTATHVGVFCCGVGLGIYLLPILIEADPPSAELVQSVAADALFTADVERDLADSDALHWGEGTIFINTQTIAFQGRLAPGPDYRLYLSPKFVETEKEFAALKSDMVQVAPVNTFHNFMVEVPASVDPREYQAVIIWCESFAQFITAARYQ